MNYARTREIKLLSDEFFRLYGGIYDGQHYRPLKKAYAAAKEAGVEAYRETLKFQAAVKVKNARNFKLSEARKAAKNARREAARTAKAKAAKAEVNRPSAFTRPKNGFATFMQNSVSRIKKFFRRKY